MQYTGKVLNRRTGLPVSGATVSDGRNVTKTDENGTYSLPGWERSRWVSVCMLTTAHDDWYHYTGGKAGTYDFALTPAETKDFSLLQTTDTEITEKTDLEWLDFIREKIGEDKPAFLIHTGDICRRAGMLRHREEMNFDTMGVPVRYVIGNHDFVPADADYGEQVYEQLYGPLWWSFECGGVYCLVLSLGHGGRGDMPSGYEKEDQWKWLQNALSAKAPQKPMVVFCHDAGPDPYEFIVGDIDLKQYGLVAWIYGHAHSNLHHIRSGVHNICTGRPESGGIDSSVAGIRYVSVTDGQVKSRMRYRRFETAPADTPLWKTALGGRITFGQLIFQDGKLYIGTMQDDAPGSCGIYCMDAASGQVIWFRPTEGGFHNNICLEDGRIYAQDCMGDTYCLNALDGSVKWKTTRRFGDPDLVTSDRTRFPAFVAGKKVITGSPSETCALDITTGELLWEAVPPKKAGHTPARPLYDPEKNRLYIGGQWGVLRCLDAASGEVLWARTEKPLWYRTQTPCLDGDVLYAGGFDTMVKLNAETGESLAEHNVTEDARTLGAPRVISDGDMNACGAPVVDGDTLYCPTAASGVLALDKKTLQVLRRFPAGPAAILTAPYVKQGAETVESQPVIHGDTLIFTASDAKVYFYDKNTAQLLKTVNLPAPSLVAPVIDGEFMYTADFDGNICKYPSF